MSNTGRKIVTTLKQVNQTTGLETGLTKPNVPEDPDYIPPTTDYASCPLPSIYSCPSLTYNAAETKITYSFSLSPSNYANSSLSQIIVTVKQSGSPVNSQTLTKSAYPSNNFTGTFTGLTNGLTYTIDIVYKSSLGDTLHTCTDLVTITITDGANCATPTGLAVVDVTSNSASFSWSPVAGVSGYQYSIDNGPWIGIGSVVAYTVNDLPSGTIGTFRVRAVDGTYNCAGIASISFETLGDSSFRLFNGTDDSSVMSINPDFGFYTIVGGSIPVVPHASVYGYQAGLIGTSISLGIPGPDLVNARLVINSSIVQDIINTNGAITFSAVDIQATDEVTIYITPST